MILLLLVYRKASFSYRAVEDVVSYLANIADRRTVPANKYITDALLNYMWRKKVGGTRGTSQMENTWNGVFRSLKAVYGN